MTFLSGKTAFGIGASIDVDTEVFDSTGRATNPKLMLPCEITGSAIDALGGSNLLFS